MNPQTPIGVLSRVGKTAAKYLQRLNITTAGHLLYYFPFRYEDFRHLAPIATLENGSLVTVKGKIELIANKRTLRRRKMITEGLVSDVSGSIKVIWFNQPYLAKTLYVGEEVYLSGKVQLGMFGAEMISPTYEKAGQGETAHTARLVPIYPLTEGISQKQLRFLVSQIINLTASVPEWLPEEILEKYDLIPLGAALRGIHFPADNTDLTKSTERLKFDELFLLQMRAELARQKKGSERAPQLEFKEALIKKFVQALPFTLTKSQKVSAWEILQDIAEVQPMNRLLSGDVGSGKTVVAAMAMYDAALNDYQAALMAPTEILAVQHFNSLKKLLGADAPLGLMTNSKNEVAGLEIKEKSKAGQRRVVLENIKEGKVKMIVGTHALLSAGVDFNNLGLVIVDEQHRFGVGQRKTMKEKGRRAHFLSMTATPIPRSLALMIYGDLDLSVINELPPGRKKIITRLVEPAKRELAYKFIREQVRQGRQVFVICPLIENEAMEKKTVMNEYKKLSETTFPDLRLGYLHGRMPAKEKDMVMEGFKNHSLDILVATSMVEVGVDIPNASVMMIEDAERFGLAQLHQFRGRVGRSEHQSYCLLFTTVLSSTVKERLKFFEQNLDGFKLAEKDLEIRGPGEVYGLAQSGMMNLRLAKLTDQEIIKKTREAAKEAVKNIKKYPSLSERVSDWEEKVHLE